MRIVGVTACHDGVVHNYLAAMRLGEAARKQQHDLRLEVRDQTGTSQALSVDEICGAELAIMAVDVDDPDSDRFGAIPVLKVSTKEAIANPGQVLAKALAVHDDKDNRAFVERKLFTNGTGHAVAAYMGAAMGYSTMKDAMADAGIRGIVRGAMEEAGAVLMARHRGDREAHARYIEKALTRLANPWTAGELKLVAAEPMLKLGPHECLIRPLYGALELGLGWQNLAYGISAVLCYEDWTDPQSVELQQRIQKQGIAAVISQYVKHSEVAAEIEKCWETIRKR